MQHFRDIQNLRNPGQYELHTCSSHASIKKKINVQFHPARETLTPDKCSKSVTSQVQRIFSAQQSECTHTRPKWTFNSLYLVCSGPSMERMEWFWAVVIPLHLLGRKANFYFQYCFSFCRTCHARIVKKKGTVYATVSSFIPDRLEFFWIKI